MNDEIRRRLKWIRLYEEREATFYVWRKKYANLGVSELRKMKQLEDENTRLKRLVADPTLDRHILQEVLRKKV